MIGQNAGVESGATREGVEHLQAAAREMVAAARAFLDAVEEVVEDDDRLSSLVGGVTDLIRGASDAVGDFGRRAPAGSAGPSPRRVNHVEVE